MSNLCLWAELYSTEKLCMLGRMAVLVIQGLKKIHTRIVQKCSKINQWITKNEAPFDLSVYLKLQLILLYFFSFRF